MPAQSHLVQVLAVRSTGSFAELIEMTESTVLFPGAG